MMEGLTYEVQAKLNIEEVTQVDDNVPKSRNIRSHYRDIESRINEEKHEIANGDSDKFMSIMNQVEIMHQHVKKPREQVADAEALLGLTSSLVASVKTHTSGGVTPAEFVSCLIREFRLRKHFKRTAGSDQNISWKNIGDLVSSVFMNGCSCMTMIGPMKNELKPRKLVNRAKLLRTKVNARPKELEKAAEMVTDTEKNMHAMFEMLKKERRIALENLILNRDSFAQTVENLFALSFLVKDGRVLIDVDDNGSQFAVPRNGPSAEDIKNGVVSSHQFIFRFDFNDWKLMKSLVPEGQELMPNRGAVFVEAKQEPTYKGLSPVDSSSNDSQPIYAAEVKKFSRNSGRIMQNAELAQVGDATIWNSDCKRKRVHM